MTSPVDVVNIALIEIGVSRTQVSSINPSDGSTEADVASIMYRPKIEALSRAAHWNCLRKQESLALLKASVIDGEASDNPPPRPWQYEYAYPVDCIKARFILPFWNNNYTGTPFTTAPNISTVLLQGPPVKFAVATDRDAEGNTVRVILTNMPQAIMVYTADFINSPDLWDPHFLAAATATLGVWFINALNRSRGLLQDQVSIATNIIAQARISDGNEGLTSADHIPDWLRVRKRTGADVGAGYYFAGWDSMALPGGTLI